MHNSGSGLEIQAVGLNLRVWAKSDGNTKLGKVTKCELSRINTYVWSYVKKRERVGQFAPPPQPK